MFSMQEMSGQFGWTHSQMSEQLRFLVCWLMGFWASSTPSSPPSSKSSLSRPCRSSRRCQLSSARLVSSVSTTLATSSRLVSRWGHWHVQPREHLQWRAGSLPTAWDTSRALPGGGQTGWSERRVWAGTFLNKHIVFYLSLMALRAT